MIGRNEHVKVEGELLVRMESIDLSQPDHGHEMTIYNNLRKNPSVAKIFGGQTICSNSATIAVTPSKSFNCSKIPEDGVELINLQWRKAKP